MVEPWLRGTLTEFDAVRRQVLHALELAEEDVVRWCGPLSEAQMEARPRGVAPVGFHLRHIARSLDRLLTYAEGRQLSEAQLAALAGEMEGAAGALDEFRAGIRAAMERVKAIDRATFEEAREVGRIRLPTTVGGLLVHCAEHTQRHVGQAITTARMVG
jgi:uncharacterized damage-inducible protein DinB